MRKTHWMLLLATVLVLGVSLGNMYLLNYGVKELDEILKPMEELIFQEQWEQAQALFEEADKTWRYDRNLWQITIDHVETENIEVAFSQLQSGLALQDINTAITGLYLLRHNIEHLLYIERLSWQNIL